MRARFWSKGAFEKGSRAINFALMLLLLALFLPDFKLPRNTFSYMVFFDITQSMNVEDYELDGAPISRLAYAHEAFEARCAICRVVPASVWAPSPSTARFFC